VAKHEDAPQAADDDGREEFGEEDERHVSQADSSAVKTAMPSATGVAMRAQGWTNRAFPR
jgi:hypothetical protein